MGTMDAPKTRYAEVGGAEVAYQVIGEQPLDLVWCLLTGLLDGGRRLAGEAQRR